MNSEFAMQAQQLLQHLEAEQIQFVDLRFTDLCGQWRHMTLPASAVDAKVLEHGVGFDGSSLPGWQGAEASDMQLAPDLATAMPDPFRQHKTIALICDVVYPGNPPAAYDRCPRSLARRCADYLRDMGVADQVFCGPEPEFSVLDRATAGMDGQSANFSLLSHESAEVPHSTAASLDHRLAIKGGYLAQAPMDQLADLRAEMALGLAELGIPVEALHHEVGAAGQSEIAMRFAPLLAAGDQLMKFKHVVKNAARARGKIATFMPKPVYGDNGNGMHVHLSLWQKGEPLFAGGGYAGLSQRALHFIAGILAHAGALCAFTNPTTNSYRRLVEGFEAPVYLCYGASNRSAAIRVPMLSTSPKAKRIEVRFGDPSANFYLMASAIVLAGLDGIERELAPPQPLERDVAGLASTERAALERTPTSLRQALAALQQDCDFLCRGNVFSPALIDSWIDLKMRQDVVPVEARPVPLEYPLYMHV